MAHASSPYLGYRRDYVADDINYDAHQETFYSTIFYLFFDRLDYQVYLIDNSF